MKILGIYASFILVTFSAFSKNFEGTIKWKISMEIKSPKMKSQMEAYKKQMEDPNFRDQLKEMEAQMKDPQMQQLFEANPQLKAQMTKMMEVSQSGDIHDMIPKEMTVKTKNQDVVLQVEGGMAKGETLFLSGKNETYLVDRKNKTYSLLQDDDKSIEQKQPHIKVTKTENSKTILGFSCNHYLMEFSRQGVSVTQSVWTTTSIDGINLKPLANQKFGKQDPFFFNEKIDGIPLMVEVNTPDAEMRVEVFEIKKESLSKEIFEIPSDFVLKPLSFNY